MKANHKHCVSAMLKLAKAGYWLHMGANKKKDPLLTEDEYLAYAVALTNTKLPLSSISKKNDQVFSLLREDLIQLGCPQNLVDVIFKNIRQVVVV